MRPEDFKDRPTVNPTTKRIYRYGQMLFGVITGMATIAAGVYAFLNSFAMDWELKESIHKNNLDIIDVGEKLPHDARFKKLENDIDKLQLAASILQKQTAKLETTSADSLEILAGYLAADSERNPKLRFSRGETARQNFRYFLSKGEPPMAAFRMAMRPPGTPLR